MNKLEKMKTENTGEIEEVNENIPSEETTEQKEDRSNKFFSLFSFWKKSDTQDSETEISEFELEESKRKRISRFINLRTAAFAASVVVIAVAAYINLRYTPVSDDIESEVDVTLDGVNTALEEKEGYVEDYFTLSVINRQRVRDEAMEILLDLTNSDATDAEAKADAYTEMTRMANEITNEANIESLVKAKGFANCVAVVSGDEVNVVVESSGLSINEVAQIKEIVYLECGVHPDNVKIIEKASV